MRLLARLGAPVLEPLLSLLWLRIFSVAIVTAGNSLLLVFLPVLLSVSVSMLILPAVSIAFAISVAVAIIAIPVITSSCVSRVSVAVIVAIAVIASEGSRVVIHTIMYSVGMPATRTVVVVMPTAVVTITVVVAGVRVVPVVDVHGAAIADWHRTTDSVVVRRHSC